MHKDQLENWTPAHNFIVKHILTDLVAYGGLHLPDQWAPFILEAYYTARGYSGILYLEEAADGGKPALVPVGCVSTTKTRKLVSAVVQTLAATLYCLEKFQD